MEPFKNLGMTTLTIRNTGGTDHLSYDAVGLPGFQFIQDEVEYDSRTHHSNMDVYERIQPNDMMRNAVIVASFVVAHREPRREAAAQAAATADAPAGRGRRRSRSISRRSSSAKATSSEAADADDSPYASELCVSSALIRLCLHDDGYDAAPIAQAKLSRSRASGLSSSRSTGHGRRNVQFRSGDRRRLVDPIAPAEGVLNRQQQQSSIATQTAPRAARRAQSRSCGVAQDPRRAASR